MRPENCVLRTKPIALVGLMGVGKTTVGRRLSQRLSVPFYDSDEEIEQASGRTIIGYFRDHGEADFRAGEQRVIDRILDGSPLVLATGGGAFIPEETRHILKERSVTIWLKGDFETIMERVSRKDTRPLLQVSDPRSRMRQLMDERYPIYAQADITVPIVTGPHSRTVNKVIRYLERYYSELNKQQSKEKLAK